MTLNELIAYAKENDIDFDTQIALNAKDEDGDLDYESMPKFLILYTGRG